MLVNQCKDGLAPVVQEINKSEKKNVIRTQTPELIFTITKSRTRIHLPNKTRLLSL